MHIAFSHQLTLEDYKKWLIDVYYFKNKKRLYGYIFMMFAGILVIIFKLTNAFGLSERYPAETLFIVGGSLIVTPIFFYIAVIRNAKKFFLTNASFYNEVKYTFDNEKIAFETYDGNTGTCKWQNVKTIEEDNSFIRIILPNESTFLFVKNKIENNTLIEFQQLLKNVKGSRAAFDMLG